MLFCFSYGLLLRDKCIFSFQELIGIAFQRLYLYGNYSVYAKGTYELKMFWAPLEQNSSENTLVVNPEVLVIVFKLTANHTAEVKAWGQGSCWKRPRVQSPYCLGCFLLFPGLELYSHLASHSQKCSLDLPMEQGRECGWPPQICHRGWKNNPWRLPCHVEKRTSIKIDPGENSLGFFSRNED